MNLSGRAYVIVIAGVLLGILGEWGPAVLKGTWKLPMAGLLLAMTMEGLYSRREFVSVCPDYPERAILGRSVSGQISLANKSSRPVVLDLVLVASGDVHLEEGVQRIRLPARGAGNYGFRFTPTGLGQVVWNDLLTRTLGRFGLAWWNRTLNVSGAVRVTPDRLYAPEKRSAVSQHEGDINCKRSGTGYDLLGMRDYQRGDPLSALDWKATARSQRPTVRVFSDEQHMELVLLVDTGRTSGMRSGALNRLGHFCNVAARLAEKGLSLGDRISVIAFADDVAGAEVRLRGRDGLNRARALLEALRPSTQDSNPLAAVMYARAVIGQRSLVVILTDLDDGDFSAQLVRAVSLLIPKHLPLVAGITDDEVLALREQPAENWLDPYHTLAALEMANGWRRGQLRMRRMGIPTVLCPARELDRQVLASYARLKDQRRV